MFQKQPWMQRAGEYPADDQGYFSLLARAVFSAGLGPKVVEARWPHICAAFHDFDPRQVAAMGEADVTRLLTDPHVIRNRRKIEAVLENARRFLSCLEESGVNFHDYLRSLGAEKDLDIVAERLSQTFVHLGRPSALFFLFSAGWRPRDMGFA
ncbi:MAG: DNA-3-methyladenine glycosylase I [Thermoleophilia bacterium]|nr:DNA-3-methyladenine glycosylase I [Thermoleophilia bacterium]